MKSILHLALSLALAVIVLVGCSQSESPIVAADAESVLSKKGGKPGGGDPPPPPDPAIVFSDGNDLKVINSDGSGVPDGISRARGLRSRSRVASCG